MRTHHIFSRACEDAKGKRLMNSSRHSQSSFFVKRFFSVSHWLYSCLKSQKTIPDYYFNSSNCYNRTSDHIIRTIILNCHVTHGWLLKVKRVIRRCWIWSMTKMCVCELIVWYKFHADSYLHVWVAQLNSDRV